MRAREFLSEVQNWSIGDITKRAGRLDAWLNLIRNKHTFNTKYGPVQIDPDEFDRLEGILTGKVQSRNKSIELRTLQGKSVRLTDLEKDASTVGGAGKSGDTKLLIKPGSVFQHGQPEKNQDITPELALNLGGFTANELGAHIQNNNHLDTQGIAGKAVKAISTQISQHQVPLIPKDVPKQQLTNVINDAYEYLGVQALIDGVALFPNIKEFYDHIGSNMASMVLLFPSSTNNPLADSYALTNKQTGNQIFISSKAGRSGSGAPSSIKKVKIPSYMLKQYKNDESLEFLTYIQGIKVAWHQPFEAAKFIKNKSKDPNSLGELLPYVDLFDAKFYTWGMNVKTSFQKNHKPVPNTLNEIPPEYQDFYNLVLKKSSSESEIPLFWHARNVVKDVFVGPAVNSGKPLPQFNSRMLEILGHNFILLKSKAEGGKINTRAIWPHKMGGRITFEKKDGADKWDSAMTWILSES